MEITYITPRVCRKLILIFLGWGVDARAFSGLRKPGYDIVCIHGYGSLGAAGCWDRLALLGREYEEVVVVAWSFGVRAAADFMTSAAQSIPLTRRIAVNGTPAHIDDSLGIPEAIFAGTLANLDERNIRKFRRRMFSSASDFAAFDSAAPLTRSVESLRDELRLFGSLPPQAGGVKLFDHAIVGGRDAIFPPDNQMRCWEGSDVEFISEMPHFPDFENIIDRLVIDKELVAERFAASASTYTGNAPVQTQVAEQLWMLARLYAAPAVGDLGGGILEIGVGNGLLTRHYAPLVNANRLMLWDIAPINADNIPQGATVSRCDAEVAIRGLADCSLSMLLSASTIQWFNNPASFVRCACQKLMSGGVMALSSFGPMNFKEIRAAAGTGLHYPDLQALAQAAKEEGCRVMVAREETIVQTFRSAADMLRHLSLTGVNAISRGKGNATAARRLMESARGGAEGKAELTYNPIYLVAVKD